MSPQEEAFEAAKLATAIGSQLKKVDQLSFGGASNPANRININEFIHCINDPNAKIINKFNQVPHGFAPPPPEELIQSMVPYQPAINPTQEPPPVVQQSSSVVQSAQVEQQSVPVQKNVVQKQDIKINSNNDDIAAIKKSVDQINKNLIRLIDIIRNKK